MFFIKKTLGKPKTDGTKSALLDGGSRGVEMPGRAGSGRAGSGRDGNGNSQRTPFQTRPGKNTPFGQTPHSDIHMVLRISQTSQTSYNICIEHV